MFGLQQHPYPGKSKLDCKVLNDHNCIRNNPGTNTFFKIGKLVWVFLFLISTQIHKHNIHTNTFVHSTTLTSPPFSFQFRIWKLVVQYCFVKCSFSLRAIWNNSRNYFDKELLTLFGRHWQLRIWLWVTAKWLNQCFCSQAVHPLWFFCGGTITDKSCCCDHHMY